MRKLIVIGVILILTLAVGACQPAEVAVPEPVIEYVEVTVVVQPTEVPPPPCFRYTVQPDAKACARPDPSR